MTTITFERSGGQIGKPVHLDVDLSGLPDAESQGLQNLITMSDFFEIPENLASSSLAPDEFKYTITVEANRSHHTVHTSDTTAPENLRPLIEELSRLADTTPT
jgi:Emfourin